MDPDFQVILRIDETTEIRSGDWVECENPEKPDSIKVSPSMLNLKSRGNWVTVKLYVDPEEEPIEFKVKVNGEVISGYSIKETGDHFLIKISREEAQEYCEEGENFITISYKIGDEKIELTETFRAIHGENHNGQMNQNQYKVKSNKGKAKGKN